MNTRATAKALVDAASSMYKPDLFAYFKARGKLAGDPAFTAILRKGLLVGAGRILDLGCGQGLLAAWLSAARDRGDERPHDWPAEWIAAPRPESLRGIELEWKDVQRARHALGPRADFEVGNITEIDFGIVDAIVILDVLHYIDYQSQLRVLSRAYDALVDGGVLLLRVGDAGSGLGFTLGKYIDQTVLLTHHRKAPRVYCRSAREWQEILVAGGFQWEAVPMSAGTPFANVLLIARPRKRVRTSRHLTDSLIIQ